MGRLALPFSPDQCGVGNSDDVRNIDDSPKVPEPEQIARAAKKIVAGLTKIFPSQKEASQLLPDPVGQPLAAPTDLLSERGKCIRFQKPNSTPRSAQ